MSESAAHSTSHTGWSLEQTSKRFLETCHGRLVAIDTISEIYPCYERVYVRVGNSDTMLTLAFTDNAESSHAIAAKLVELIGGEVVTI